MKFERNTAVHNFRETWGQWETAKWAIEPLTNNYRTARSGKLSTTTHWSHGYWSDTVTEKTIKGKQIETASRVHICDEHTTTSKRQPQQNYPQNRKTVLDEYRHKTTRKANTTRAKDTDTKTIMTHTNRKQKQQNELFCYCDREQPEATKWTTKSVADWSRQLIENLTSRQMHQVVIATGQRTATTKSRTNRCLAADVNNRNWKKSATTRTDTTSG